jgi:hypothetical protein
VNSLPPNTYRFTSTFAGLPVQIQYVVEVSEDHTGADVEVIPEVCFLDGNDTEIDLCEDAGLFHPQQLEIWLSEALAHYKNLGTADYDEPKTIYYSTATLDYMAASAGF